MKILQLTNRIPFPLNDGGNIATYNVTRYLHDFGHKVTMASLNTNKHYQDPSVLSSIATIKSVDINTDLSFSGLISGIFSSEPYNVKRFYSPAFEKMLVQLLTEEKFDIIQLEGIYLAIYIKVIRRYSKVPIVLRSHNIEHEIWQRMSENEKNPLKKWYLNMLSTKIRNFELDQLQYFDAIVAITDKDNIFYKSNGYKGKLVTINAGVDIDAYKPSLKKLPLNKICFLGSMEWLPNLQGVQWFIKEVWPLVYDKNTGIEFHIAGKAMPAALMTLNVPGIKVHGTVEDAIAFMNTYRILIVPLLSGGGMRLKIVEAMALGKSIVSTTIGAEGIEIKNGENILLANTPKEFAAAILDLVSDEKLCDLLSEKAIRTAHQRYNWFNLVKKFESLYRECLGV